MDDLLVEQHGGHGDGARVCLTDGRPATVYAAEWSEAGAPVAYRIRELEPGRHGNIGKLVPSLISDELVSRDQTERRGIARRPLGAFAGPQTPAAPAFRSANRYRRGRAPFALRNTGDRTPVP
ncbi:hypothetical protein [Streptomyces sp. NPDC002215]|uniref:hypothetical protein n=1 Tax=Streptomyces sp. NPDC002215 TaxID=3154412 RepID=UPI003320EBB3